jgi:hypothetical protein
MSYIWEQRNRLTELQYVPGLGPVMLTLIHDRVGVISYVLQFYLSFVCIKIYQIMYIINDFNDKDNQNHYQSLAGRKFCLR